MVKLDLLSMDRRSRLGRRLAVLGVFLLIVFTAQLPALLGYAITDAAHPGGASARSAGHNGGNEGSGGNRGKGHPGTLPPDGGPGTDPASTPKPEESSPTPDQGKAKATDTPYPQNPSPTMPAAGTPTLPLAMFSPT